MGIESPIGNPQQMMQLIAATRTAAVAALAGGIIAASGRPHSIAEAQALCNNIHHAMYPQVGSGNYQAFERDKDAIINKVYS